MSPDRDSIEFERFENAISCVADEMAVAIVRTDYCALRCGNMSFSTEFAAARGGYRSPVVLWEDAPARR